MKSLIFTLLILTGFLKERDIKDSKKFYNHIEIWQSRPVCPVYLETDCCLEDLQSDETQFVQEKLKPIPLIISGELRCDGLLCPIQPREDENIKPAPELSNAIIQDFLLIGHYMKFLVRENKTKTNMEEILEELMSPEIYVLVVLEVACLYFYDYLKARKDKDDASAGTECKGEQSPVIKHHNSEEDEKEETLPVGESKMWSPRQAKVSIQRKKQVCFVNEHQGSKLIKKRLGFNVRKCRCPSKRKRTINEEEINAFNQLLLQFLIKGLNGEDLL